MRLIEPAATPGDAYFTAVPDAFAPPTGLVRIVPLHHVFGSEELSTLAEGVAALERGGAAMYRAWAADESDEVFREALLEAARREEENAEVLER